MVRDDIARFVTELENYPGDTSLASLPLAADPLVEHYESDRRFHIGLFSAAFGADASEVRGILSAEAWTWCNALVEAAMDSGELSDIIRPRQQTDG